MDFYDLFGRTHHRGNPFDAESETKRRLLREAKSSLKQGYDKENFVKQSKHLESLLCAVFSSLFCSLPTDNQFDSNERKVALKTQTQTVAKEF